MSNIIYPKSKVYTDQNVTGSGKINDPVILKDQISVEALTASNLLINGTASINVLNTVEQTSLKIGDKYITIMTGANTQAQLNGSGILFGSASSGESGEQGSVAHIIYRDSGDQIEIYPGLKVSGSAQIVGNLTASNISGTLIGPAGGILSGSYPNPSGLSANSSGVIPIAPYNNSNSASFITNQNISNLYIKTTTSGNQGTHITIEASSGTLSTSNNGGNVNITAGLGGTSNRGGNITIKSYGQTNIRSEPGATSNGGSGGTHAVNIYAGNTDTSQYVDDTDKKITLNVSGGNIAPSSNGYITIGADSNFGTLGYINIGKASVDAGKPKKIDISDSSVPVYYNGIEIHSGTYLVPTISSTIQVTNNTICLVPTASLTMSANPTLLAIGYNNTSPDGARVTLINNSQYSICFLNDDSLSAPLNYNSAYLSSSLKLGSSQRVLKPLGILSLQYQKSGSTSTAGGFWIETNFSNNLTGGVDLSPYALLSGSIITASSLRTDYIDFDTTKYDLTAPTTPGHVAGRLFFDSGSGDLVTGLNHTNLYLKNGQQLLQRVKNAESSSILKGKVVHITGSDQSNAAVPRIRLADWSNDGMSANTIGVAMTDMSASAEGFIIIAGMLDGLNTNDYSGGDILYLSSSGGFTNIKPTAPKHTVSIGQVIRTNTNVGSIYVKIQNGYELDELHDVSASVGKTNGDLLVWDNANSVWKNSKILSGSYNISGALTASYFVGDGSNLTNLPASSTIYTSGSITGSGTIANPITLKSEINVNAVTASVLLNGFSVIASGPNSHAEGWGTIASGYGSHAQGSSSIASGDFSHAEGGPTSLGNIGTSSVASGQSSHAEGTVCSAIGEASHAEGIETRAYGLGSHTEGLVTKAYFTASHAEGIGTIASGSGQHVQGQYNQTSSTALMIIGNGTSAGPTSRSNIVEVYSDKMVISGNLAFPNGNGIDFGATSGSGTTSNILNDYEEGTWTPVANGFSTSSNPSYPTTGYYIKIGNYVNLTARFVPTTINNLDYLTGIPYAALKQGIVITAKENSSDVTIPNSYVDTGSNRVYLGDGTFGAGNTDYIVVQASYYVW